MQWTLSFLEAVYIEIKNLGAEELQVDVQEQKGKLCSSTINSFSNWVSKKFPYNRTKIFFSEHRLYIVIIKILGNSQIPDAMGSNAAVKCKVE